MLSQEEPVRTGARAVHPDGDRTGDDAREVPDGDVRALPAPGLREAEPAADRHEQQPQDRACEGTPLSKSYCPRCQDLYKPKKKCRDVDGAFFGTSFPHVLLKVPISYRATTTSASGPTARTTCPGSSASKYTASRAPSTSTPRPKDSRNDLTHKISVYPLRLPLRTLRQHAVDLRLVVLLLRNLDRRPLLLPQLALRLLRPLQHLVRTLQKRRAFPVRHRLRLRLLQSDLVLSLLECLRV